MSDQNKNIGGSGLVIGLLIVLLAGAGLFGWMEYNKSKQMNALPEASEMAQVPQEEMHSTPPPLPIENTPVPPVVTELAPSVGSSKIDVEKSMSVRAIGNPDAPIKMVEYASLTCSHCAHFHNDVLPEMKTKYIDTGKVYLEFREFPLNDPALKATLTARCLPEDKYDGFVSLLFKTQEHWAGGMDYMASLRQNAKLAGMSDDTFDACQAEPDLKLKIAERMQEAKDKWKIEATPTFIINDGAEKISGAVPLTEFERVFRKASNGAVGEAPKVE